MDAGDPLIEAVGPPPPGDAPPTRRSTGPVPLPGTPHGGPPSASRRREFDWKHSSALYIGIGVSGALAFFFALGGLGYYNIPFIIQNLPSGYGPLELSLEFTTFSFVGGLAPAFALGLLRAHPPKLSDLKGRKNRRGRFSFIWRWPAYAFATGYVATVRGTPFLVQMFIVTLAVTVVYPTFTLWGWNQFYWCGLLALFINTTGYQGEVFRGGIQSVEAGQIEGGKAMGFSRVQIFFRVTLPQTFRLITLPLTNEWISNFKTATILSYISIFEVYFWSKNTIAIQDVHPIEAFVMLTIFYLLINVTLSRVVTYIEKVRRIPGLGTPVPEIAYSKRILGSRRPTTPGAGAAPSTRTASEPGRAPE